MGKENDEYGGKGKFDKIVSGISDLKHVDAGVSVFGKEFGDKLEYWKKIGAGREIHAPLLDSEGNPSKETRLIFYALPFTDETVSGHNKRVLLVYPRDEGYNLYTVAPKRSKLIDREYAESADEGFLSDFDATFLPSKSPYTERQWVFDGRTPNERLRNISYLDYISQSAGWLGTTPEQDLEKAEGIAQKRIEKIAVNELDVGDIAMTTIFDANDVAFMTGLGKQTEADFASIEDFVNDPANGTLDRSNQIESE